MKTLREKIRGRMRVNRPMTTVSLRIPEDLIPDLEEMAPVLGFGSYQALLRSYISQGMREDEARLAQPEVRVLRETLQMHGIAEEVISEVLAETLRESE